MKTYTVVITRTVQQTLTLRMRAETLEFCRDILNEPDVDYVRAVDDQEGVTIFDRGKMIKKVM